MDNVTHLGVGALCALGVVKLARKRRQEQELPATWLVLLTGAIAGNFPDIDFLTYFINPLYYDAYWHRGATHSLVLAPLWATLVAGAFWLSLWRRRNFQLVLLICLAGIYSHILVDLLTAWDIALWYPFNRQGHSIGIIFIIDLVLTATIYIGLWAALSHRRRVLVLSLGVACSWPLLAFTQQQRALSQAEHVAHESTRAWAQPFSIFNWMLVRTTAQGYDIMHIRTTQRDGIRWPLSWMQQSAQAYQPKDRAHWRSFLTYNDENTQRSWKHPDMYAVRDFMTYPVLLETDTDCVWFTDLLYTLPNMGPAFVYGACEDNHALSVERRTTQAPWAGEAR